MGYCPKHIFHVIAMYSFIILVEYITISKQVSNKDTTANQLKAGYEDSPPFVSLATIFTIIAMTIQLLVLLPVPQIIFNLLGLTFFDAFKKVVKLKNKNSRQNALVKVDEERHRVDSSEILHNQTRPNGIRIDAGDLVKGAEGSNRSSTDYTSTEDSILIANRSYHICFRVVTRGLYPDLVRRNLNRNLLTCTSSNLKDFSFEIVTDTSLDCLTSLNDKRVRQIVVPQNYRSSTGAMFKARALQYALEPNTSPVVEGDYIVHLDEETILTNNSINGILNFTSNKQHSFGQGLIVYMNDEVVNWITTLADSFRVAEDMGKLRFQFSVLHKPLFGWKGSYVVTKYEAERDVSFDHGPDGSVAEDCYFSMIALSKGYSFDFIEGEMLEKSPFTISDAIRQRKRWLQGFWLVVHSPKIPVRAKLFLAMSCYAWASLPLTTSSYILTLIFPISSSPWIVAISTFCFAVSLYLYIFGLLKSYDLKESVSRGMLVVFMLGQASTLFLNIVIENIAVVWGLMSSKHHFYIVAKDTGHKNDLEV